MADITMCQDQFCKQKDDCYRHTAPANPHWQSYFVTSPREGDTCTYFWENNEQRIYQQRHADPETS